MCRRFEAKGRTSPGQRPFSAAAAAVEQLALAGEIEGDAVLHKHVHFGFDAFSRSTNILSVTSASTPPSNSLLL